MPESIEEPKNRKIEKSPYTLLIVTWKGDELLRDCLSSIAKACAKSVPPCVVVDNAASETARALCREFSFVEYVPSEENLGFAGGNNLGLAHCHTPYICLLNNDTRVLQDSFTPLVEFLEAHPAAAVAQGTMILPRCGNTLDDCGTYLKWYGLQHHRYFLSSTPPSSLKPARVFSAKGAFMMVRSSAILAAGGLFHDHFMSYYEETDFCHRVWLSGGEVWFVPTPPIEHLMGATSALFPRADIWRVYIANIFFSFSVNFSREGRLRILVPFTFVYIGFTLFNLLALRFGLFKAMISVPRINRRRSSAATAARARVRSIRRISDHALLKQIICRA